MFNHDSYVPVYDAETPDNVRATATHSTYSAAFMHALERAGYDGFSGETPEGYAERLGIRRS